MSRLAIRRAEDDVSSAVSIAASEYQATIEQTGHFLLALSHSSEVMGGNGAVCDRFLKSMIQDSPIYFNLTIVQPDGMLFSSAAEHTGVVSYADRSWFALARQTKKFVNGGFQIGKITGRPMFTLAYPVLDSRQEVGRIIVAAVDTAWLSKSAANVKLPPGSVVTVFDREGTILARSPNAETWIGRGVPEAPIVAEAVRKNAPGTRQAAGVDGVMRVYAFMPLSGTAGAGAYVSVGIPTSEVFADTRRMLIAAMTGLVVVLAGAVLAVWLGSEVLILRGVRALLTATGRLARGEPGVRAGAGLASQGEIGALAAAFDVMAESLEKREAERREAEDRIRALAEALEQRVAERTAQLEEANHDLEAFSYSVSHDLRAPLRHVSGFADLLSKHASLDERSGRYITVIKESCRRMSALIDDLLAFSRIGRASLELTEVSLRDLVDEAAAEAARDAAGPGVAGPGVAGPGPAVPGADARRIAWKVGDLPTVRADHRLLRLALVNLLSNAVKYTRPRAEAVIEVACTRADGEVVVRISDNGVGFDPRFASRLFGVFQRLHAADQFEGTGIGLATVKNIIVRHGGRVWAEGEPDRGSSFYFTLPERG